ncbi:signal recognition particle protein [Sulfuriferula plumbiphila]|uniref:Signal recognition particle protein n=1 Tax=Sulfuriferula plumbiphila TaxID=171865 RepID=A0A512L504_9PROT|nr:signal recognition particle protein [Sulfuriferula plumbiphila]BBP03243.1 signal recognition particle protein [Sulfuriferula plumbiphila]GEP29530.1 signal recognition particle protein [Sulfuriferula plumbiphila]
MLDNLTSRLSSVIKNLRGQARLTETNIQDALREVRMALLEADVALPVVKDFIAQVRDKALGVEVLQSLTPGQALIGVVHDELTRLMGEHNAALNLATTPPAVILMAGLQGSGKTTSSGKLARLLKEQMKKKVLLVSCDVYRPAAIEQLKTLAGQLGVDCFPSSSAQKPVDIALAAHDYARKHFHDVLIVDTAGRLGIDQAMMDEIRALHGAVKPIETLFVVDAMQGQDAVNTARAFNDTLPLTGVILTKLDGDSRGGAALSVRHITGKPIKFVGVGEKLTGLEAFHPERMASRVLGMGDVLSLIEEAQRGVDHAEAKKLADKVKSGKNFDLEDFKAQITQMRKMGGLSAMMDKLPGAAGAALPAGADEKAMNRVEGIINSMTPAERRKPELLKAARKRRIAAGAGVQVQEVNRLLKQFEQAQKMMKMMSKGGLAKMMRGMKGMLPGM